LEGATDRALTTDFRLASLDLTSLYQTKNLEADLAHLQADLKSIRPLSGATKLIQEIQKAEPATLMGIYYVFEGSKNGARFIAKAMAKAWGKTDTTGFRYLDPHGEAQRGLWLKFRSAMDAISWTPAEQDQMIKAAQATFDAISSVDDAIQAG
jgi:heme oxygenase